MRNDLQHKVLEAVYTSRETRKKNNRLKGYKKLRYKQEREGIEVGTESMKLRYGWNSRRSESNWGFIKNIIIGNVGRKWDDVYSDLKRFLVKERYNVYAATNYLDNIVARNVFEKNGELYNQVDKPIRLQYAYDAYVEPETGILRKVYKVPYRRKKPIRDYIVPLQDNNLAIRDKKGIWWYCFMKELPPKEKSACSYNWISLSHPKIWDSFLKTDVDDWDVKNFYGVAKYCYSYHQLNKVDIRRLKKILKEKANA